MSVPTRNGMKYVVSALLTIGFLYLAFRGTDLSGLYQSVLSVNYGWMVVNVALLHISHGFRAWRWRFLLNPIKRSISIRTLFSGVMVGYLMNNVLPRAGEIVRPYALGRKEHISKSAALGTILVERIIDTATFLALVAIIPLVYDGPLKESFPWLEESGTVVAITMIVVLGVMVTLMIRRDWTDRLLAICGHILPNSLVGRLERFVHSFLDGFLFLKNPEASVVIIVLSVVVWGVYVLMTYAAFFAFDLQGVLGIRAAIVVLAISSIGFAVPTPGAAGTYHFFTSQTLIKLFGIDNSTALGFSTVTHGAGFIGTTLVGLYFLLKDHVSVHDAVAEKPAEPAG